MTDTLRKQYESSAFVAGVIFFAGFKACGIELPALFWIILLLTVGTYHGGYDACLLDRIYPNKKARLGAYCTYALAALSLFALWWISPILFFVILVGETLYHFGGEDSLNSGWVAIPEGLARGLIPFTFSCYFYPDQVTFLFKPLLNSETYAQFFTQGAATLLPITLVSAAVAAVCAEKKFSTAIELITLGFAFFIFTPLESFTLYFVLLHSLRHMRQIHEAMDVSYLSIWLEPKAWLAVFCSVIPLSILYLYHPAWNEGWLSYPFLAFGCLTLPHLLLQRRVDYNLFFNA